jgi:NAD(P)-dependent dehydrogenase (short-subunit alcohol dehydrogenase family)
MAVEGFTESLALELQPFDVRVKLVEPGYGPGTRLHAVTDPSPQLRYPAGPDAVALAQAKR